VASVDKRGDTITTKWRKIRTDGEAAAQIESALNSNLRRNLAPADLACPLLDGRFWTASVDIKGSGHNRKRALKSVSATTSTPLQAVAALVEMLDTGETPQGCRKMPRVPAAIRSTSSPPAT